MWIFQSFVALISTICVIRSLYRVPHLFIDGKAKQICSERVKALNFLACGRRRRYFLSHGSRQALLLQNSQQMSP